MQNIELTDKMQNVIAIGCNSDYNIKLGTGNNLSCLYNRRQSVSGYYFQMICEQ